MLCQNIAFSIMGRCLCLIEKDQINCPKFGHVEIKIVSDSDPDKTVKVWVHVYILYSLESAMVLTGSMKREGLVMGFRKT